MIEVRDCDDYEAAKELILEYSKINLLFLTATKVAI